MGKTTITVEESTLERFNDLKERVTKTDHMPEQSADLFLQSLMDTWEKVEDEGYGDVGDLSAFGGTVPDTGSATSGVIASELLEDVHDDLQKLQEITERVPQDTADTLEGRFR